MQSRELSMLKLEQLFMTKNMWFSILEWFSVGDMEDGGVDTTVKSAAQDGLNDRLSSSFSFFSFWLITAWCTSNEISDYATRIDEFS